MKKLVVSTCLLMFFAGMSAQEVSEQDANQKTKAINQVKLSEQAMYAEVVELASDDFEAVSLAQQKTINKLQSNVIEACAQKMNITKEQAKEIFDIIDDKCQNVVVRKGDMVRVFAYIAKDAVGLTRKKAKQKDIDAIFGPDEEEEADSALIADNTAQAMALLMGKNDSIDHVSYQQPPAGTTMTTTTTTTTVVTTTAVTQPVVAQAQPTTPPVQPVNPPVQQTAPPAQPVVAAPTQPVVATPAQPVVVAPAQPVVAPAPAPAPVVAPAPAPQVVVPALCQTMIDKGNMKELMRYLSQEKRYHRLMFGNSNSMQYPEKCYIVIIDKGTQNIVSLLDKGGSERMNFISKQMDRYVNYRDGNYAAVFVQEY